MQPKLLSFGEIIWDVYDSDAFIGGAGLNFAAHCSKCGADSYLFSAVGNDDLGRKAICAINGFNINKRLIKQSDKMTGQCIVRLDDKGTPDFNVLDQTAYDNIEISEEDISFINSFDFDALYFGTLIQKNTVSRQSLRILCEKCSFKEIVCDINLRKNCYDRDSVKFCLENATILKISEEEEPLLRELKLYSANSDSYEELSKTICASYPQIRYLILTLGGKGSFVYCSAAGTHFVSEAKKVSVASTVGAGDSFIAAWLTSYLSGNSAEAATQLATRLSGFVVSKTDAIPNYTLKDGIIYE